MHGEPVSIKHINFSKPLGQGAFAVVYIGTDINDKLFVIKQFNLDPTKFNTPVSIEQINQYKRIFSEEIRTHLQLLSRNIIRPIAIDDLEGETTLFLDFIPFCLQRWIQGVDGRRISVPAVDALDVIQQLCKALTYLHEDNEYGPIAHKDIKIDNIFIDYENNVRLGDFGIAQTLIRSSTSADMIGWGGVLAPVRAPEQTRGVTTTASDMWATGVLLYQLLTGNDAQIQGYPFGIVWEQNPELVKSFLVSQIPLPELQKILLALINENDLRCQTGPQLRFILMGLENTDTVVGNLLRKIKLSQIHFDRSNEYYKELISLPENDYLSMIGACRQAIVELERAIEVRRFDAQECFCIPYFVRLATLYNACGNLLKGTNQLGEAKYYFEKVVELASVIRRNNRWDPQLEQQLSQACSYLSEFANTAKNKLDLSRIALASQVNATKACPSLNNIRVFNNKLRIFETRIEACASEAPELITDELHENLTTFKTQASIFSHCVIDSFDSYDGWTEDLGNENVLEQAKIVAVDCYGTLLDYYNGDVKLSIKDDAGNDLSDVLNLEPTIYNYKNEDHGTAWVSYSREKSQRVHIVSEILSKKRFVVHVVDQRVEGSFQRINLMVTVYDGKSKWIMDYQGRIRISVVSLEGRLFDSTQASIYPSEFSFSRENLGRCNLTLKIRTGFNLPYKIVIKEIDGHGTETMYTFDAIPRNDFIFNWTTDDFRVDNTNSDDFSVIDADDSFVLH